ncbi:hypothetical protein PG985_015857 [Apiospora marii]|uniref:uncharacterized protein n=1 Tax=Apiospora marii TaxID=335849 RepID=UPI00312FEC7B
MRSGRNKRFEYPTSGDATSQLEEHSLGFSLLGLLMLALQISRFVIDKRLEFGPNGCQLESTCNVVECFDDLPLQCSPAVSAFDQYHGPVFNTLSHTTCHKACFTGRWVHRKKSLTVCLVGSTTASCTPRQQGSKDLDMPPFSARPAHPAKEYLEHQSVDFDDGTQPLGARKFESLHLSHEVVHNPQCFFNSAAADRKLLSGATFPDGREIQDTRHLCVHFDRLEDAKLAQDKKMTSGMSIWAMARAMRDVAQGCRVRNILFAHVSSLTGEHIGALRDVASLVALGDSDARLESTCLNWLAKIFRSLNVDVARVLILAEKAKKGIANGLRLCSSAMLQSPAWLEISLTAFNNNNAGDTAEFISLTTLARIRSFYSNIPGISSHGSHLKGNVYSQHSRISYGYVDNIVAAAAIQSDRTHSGSMAIIHPTHQSSHCGYKNNAQYGRLRRYVSVFSCSQTSTYQYIDITITEIIPASAGRYAPKEKDMWRERGNVHVGEAALMDKVAKTVKQIKCKPSKGVTYIS